MDKMEESREPVRPEPEVEGILKPWNLRPLVPGLLVLGFLGLLACIGYKAWSGVQRSLPAVSRAELRGERGEETGLFRGGERVRLALELRRPAWAIVFLEDTGGEVSQIEPAGGGILRIEPPAAALPRGPGRAWDTAGLEPGRYCLWVLSFREPVDDGERIRTRLQEILGEARAAEAAEGGDRRRPAGHPEVAGPPPVDRVSELRPGIEGVAALPFLVWP